MTAFQRSQPGRSIGTVFIGIQGVPREREYRERVAMSVATQFAQGVVDRLPQRPDGSKHLNYAAHNPWDAAVAGTQAVAGYIPKLVANLVPPVKLW